MRRQWLLVLLLVFCLGLVPLAEAGVPVADLTDLGKWFAGNDKTPLEYELTIAEDGYFGDSCLQISYRVTEEYEPGMQPRVYVGSRFPAQDWSEAEYLSFWIKILPGSKANNISPWVRGTGKGGNAAVKIPFAEYASLQGWQKITVPMEKVAAVAVPLEEVVEFRFYLTGIWNVGTTGTVLFDALYLDPAEPTFDVDIAEASGQLTIQVADPEDFAYPPKVRVMDLYALLGIGEPKYLTVTKEGQSYVATYDLAGANTVTIEVIAPGQPIKTIEWKR